MDRRVRRCRRGASLPRSNATWYSSAPMLLSSAGGRWSIRSSGTPSSSRNVSRRASSIAASQRPTSGSLAIGSSESTSRSVSIAGDPSGTTVSAQLVYADGSLAAAREGQGSSSVKVTT
jgi:hypothetical protein